MEKVKILWVDDEIELLKPHILFLERKGYSISTANNGEDAIDMIDNQGYDIIFLDENMPGISGLETLSLIYEKHNIPVVMITKSEEEYIMEEALGSKISDYLIKPVNPHQILLTLKKNLDTKRLVNHKVTSNYQKDFREISMALIEACINAFEHSESNKQIEIHFRIKGDELEIQVTDKGKGFDESNVKIPKIESKLNSDERKRGWGIMLIKELMDSVDFESDHTGTTLTMVKKKDTNE